MQVWAAPQMQPVQQGDCPDDPQEPNNWFDEATPIPFDVEIYGNICNSDDLDYFSFPLNAGQQVIIDLYGLEMDSNIDLYSPAQTLITSSANTGPADEQIVYTAEETGTYYVVVWGTENELPNFYTLRVRLAAAPTPTFTPTPDCPDLYEPNDGFEQATNIDADVDIYAYICNSDDLDYFAFYASPGQEIILDLFDMELNANLELYGPEQNFLTGSYNEGVEPEQIVYTANIGGPYYALVFGTEGELINPYTLRLHQETPPTQTPTATPTPTVTRTPTATPTEAACPGDYAGDDFNNANEIYPGNLYTAYLCPAGDEDWFKFPAIVGQQITVQLLNLPADYDLQLYSPSNQLLVDGHQSGTTGEQIFWTAHIAGDYRARVYSPLGASSSQGYNVRLLLSATPTPTPTPTLTPTVTPTPTATLSCPHDPFEYNDTFDRASYMTHISVAYLCPPTDDDWYQFQVVKGEAFEIELVGSPSDYDLELYDPGQKRIARSANVGASPEKISFTAAQTGRYRLRVNSVASNFTTYKYQLTVENTNQPRPYLFSSSVHSQPFDIAVNGNTVYWSEQRDTNVGIPGGIYRNEYGGNVYGPTTVYSSTSASPADLVYDFGDVFFREWVGNHIVAIDPSTQAPTPTIMASAKNVADSRGIEANYPYVYWGDALSLNKQNISSKNIDGLVTFGSGMGPVDAMTASYSYLYWTDTTYVNQKIYGRIHRTSKNNGSTLSRTSLVAGAFHSIDIVSHFSSFPQDVYAASEHDIVVWNKAGTAPLVVLYSTPPDVSISGMTVDDNYIYWLELDPSSNALMYMPRGGGDALVLTTGLNNPRALVDDFGTLYWSESGGVMAMAKPGAFRGSAPRISVQHQPQNPPAGATITITATASDDKGIRSIDIIVRGAVVATCKSDTCTYTFKAPNHGVRIDYRAIATDVQNLRASTPIKWILVDNIGPDKDKDMISDLWESILCTNPNNPDSDSDEILDGWELLGQPFSDGTVLDLPGMGANPCRPDVFVEIDWNAGVAPIMPYIQQTINEYRRHGIALHVDTGQMGGGSQIPLRADAYTATQARDQYSSPYRAWTFHYALSTSHCGKNKQGKTECRSFADSGSNLTIVRATGSRFGYNFMHELGHTVGLGHGGTTGKGQQQRNKDYIWYKTAWINTNYKPNYFGMMNYAQSYPLYWNGSRIVVKFGYSEVALPSLNENSLDERSTSAFAKALAAYPQVGPGKPVIIYYCKKPTPRYRVYTTGDRVVQRYNYQTKKTEYGPFPKLNGIDWNCNGKIESSVKADINDDNQYTTLRGRADWPYLPLKTKCLNPRNSYATWWLQKADNPPCPKSAAAATTFTLEQTEEPHLDPIPEELDTTYEMCNGEDSDGNGIIDDGCPDSDEDGVSNAIDNCPYLANVDQVDVNRNGIGDACEVPPSPPQNLTASNEAGGVILRWEPPAEADIVGYVIERSDPETLTLMTEFGPYPTVPGTATTYFDRTPQQTGSYVYQVRAVNWAGYESVSVSAAVEVTELEAPTLFLPWIGR